VVSSGILQLVPVAALHDGKDYLVGRFTLTYAQSSTALIDPAKEGAPTTSPRAAGSGTLSKGGASRRRRLSGLVDGATTGGWASMGPGVAAQPPLPFARREVSALGELFPAARLYRRDAATRAALRQELRRATTLHLAMHAALSIDEPLRSAFVLADGRLSLGDILALGPIAPRLVIASSCNAGAQLLDGADLIGLQPRLLQIAGARQVLGSVWRASDLGAALVIKRVLRGLASGLDVASALRKAQEALRRRRPHPGFWAGFRVDGLAP
ncbi:MAG: CHAT domain-containing protein, partial [Deltaproteobacteria bacterium]|nr:CHAT domain-containing protein [Deltaproteobacteria bacterium]